MALVKITIKRDTKAIENINIYFLKNLRGILVDGQGIKEYILFIISETDS